jgi:hypothetical protein
MAVFPVVEAVAATEEVSMGVLHKGERMREVWRGSIWWEQEKVAHGGTDSILVTMAALRVRLLDKMQREGVRNLPLHRIELGCGARQLTGGGFSGGGWSRGIARWKMAKQMKTGVAMILSTRERGVGGRLEDRGGDTGAAGRRWGRRWQATTGRGMGVPRCAWLPRTAGPRPFSIFQDYFKPKPKLTSKFQIDIFPASKNHAEFWDDRVDQGEQLSFSVKLQNENKFWIINSKKSRIWILTGSKPFRKNHRNSPKLYLGMSYTNIILDEITCIADFNVPLQVSFGVFGENYERFKFEFGIQLRLGLMALQYH